MKLELKGETKGKKLDQEAHLQGDLGAAALLLAEESKARGQARRSPRAFGCSVHRQPRREVCWTPAMNEKRGEA